MTVASAKRTTSFLLPRTKASTFRRWTTAPSYYLALIMLEKMEEEDSQIMALLFKRQQHPHPRYVVHKDGQTRQHRDRLDRGQLQSYLVS